MGGMGGGGQRERKRRERGKLICTQFFHYLSPRSPSESLFTLVVS